MLRQVDHRFNQEPGKAARAATVPDRVVLGSADILFRNGGRALVCVD